MDRLGIDRIIVIGWGCMISGLLIGFLSAYLSVMFGDSLVFTIICVIGALLAVGGLIFLSIFLKCPYCGRHFYPYAIDISYCKYCGQSLSS